VPNDNISLIPALGMHGALTNIEYRKKLGDEVVRSYPIYNHNPYDNCDYVGDTETGVPVWLNREYLACDLRLGIGCITPHVHAGFGGGGKLILPGISGIETITAFHRDVQMRDPASTGLGRYDGNEMNQEIKRVSGMAGMAMKVDVLLNSRGEMTDVFAGEPIEEHAAGVAVAKEHYATKSLSGCDIVIVNAYAKYNEMGICMIMALNCVNFDRGTIVLIVDAPEGQVCHYLFRSFGKGHGGRLYFPRTTMPTGAVPSGLECIVMSAYHDRTMCDLFAPIEDVQLTENWEQTLDLLEKRFPEGARVAVVPDGTMQYYTDPWT
jgi:nickel-dependent lactate racemase